MGDSSSNHVPKPSMWSQIKSGPMWWRTAGWQQKDTKLVWQVGSSISKNYVCYVYLVRWVCEDYKHCKPMSKTLNWNDLQLSCPCTQWFKSVNGGIRVECMGHTELYTENWLLYTGIYRSWHHMNWMQWHRNKFPNIQDATTSVQRLHASEVSTRENNVYYIMM